MTEFGEASDADLAICHFPEHKEFVINCRKAEMEAKKSGQNIQFFWRGYRVIVAPNLPPMTPSGIEVRLMNALQKISKKSTAETMVNNNKKLNYSNSQATFLWFIIVCQTLAQ